MRRPRTASAKTERIAPQFITCLAKTWQNENGKILPGRTVFEHCLIVARVAEELLARYPRELADSLFPEHTIALPGVHDVGKISPTFLRKIYTHLTSSPKETYAEFSGLDEYRWGGHAGVSQLALQELVSAPYIAEIAGQHHGFTPPVAGEDIIAEKFGGDNWQKEREKFVVEVFLNLKCDWPVIDNYATALVVAGLTTVADWIGSGCFFEDPDRNWQKNISPALDAAGFIAPSYQENLSFEQIFSFSPYLAQQAFIKAVQGPGVYILEAPMGHGKTEAALYAAYSMAWQGKASGIYFALPTQLTSNKIYDRFNGFLEKILDPSSSHLRALLLHGAAWMQEMEMGEEGRPGFSWFNAKKRGLLAPFAVGTIDQALMAVMNVKHGFVRVFGLAGKVVILDEVHTYDIYTSTILDALIKLLRQLHCTVIILSATLAGSRRTTLLDAPIQEKGYPLISALPRHRQNADSIEIAVPTCTPQEIRIENIRQSEQAVEEALCRAEQGQQVLWLENTITEAQQRYLSIAARAVEIGCECGLLHSRFTPQDREKNENYWVDLFGRTGWKRRGDCGRILVGTQVLEQSLDIDGDFLVSRLCPIDMLLQRLGRLWRHLSTPRPVGARPEAWILVPEQAGEGDPSRIFGVSGGVYSPYVLHRTLEVWLEKSVIRLPGDIRDLIEETYQERQEHGFMAELQRQLIEGDHFHKGVRALQQFARLTLARSGGTLPEKKAETRYSEQDSCEVLLYRHLRRQQVEQQTVFTLLDGTTVNVPWQRHRLSWKEWRHIARLLMRQVVRVRPGDAPKAVNRTSLAKTGLGNALYLGPPEISDALLRCGQVTEKEEIRGLDGQDMGAKKRFYYRKNIGYAIGKWRDNL